MQNMDLYRTNALVGLSAAEATKMLLAEGFGLTDVFESQRIGITVVRFENPDGWTYSIGCADDRVESSFVFEAGAQD